MPELPEVEVCRLGITPHILKQTVTKVIVRHWQLRWPVSADINDICGHQITQVERRAKYLLLKTKVGTLVLHLGMSGTIRVIDKTLLAQKHDHFDLVLDNNKALRLNDPRRFGAVLWLTGNVQEHPLFASMGPEPLQSDFTESHLYLSSRQRKTPIKNFIMDNKVVVGVGNIYANESLFLAGIKPTVAAGSISKARYVTLTHIIKQVLAKAITQGGTTLKDFTQADGKPGYFAQSLQVYGRAKQPCVQCKTLLKEIKQAGRATVYCPQCQKR
ncbi:bifunctional DNA-formamidopyrimidine glycosylase/DNA-(apurinic or apyrimidinic site) lyase [Thalassotalea aquiviva]|uniref:bifunctional DNA-formamidopyrimidine glycosylase/DNA-(apurinic or apyrimidinic site) lyase n=1 Tax=Thalassotalea aquiviva TaxID=3242415 RepID=UPI00352B44D5